jgi:hypothetical protein
MALKDWKKVKTHAEHLIAKWTNNTGFRTLNLQIEKYADDKKYYIWLNENPGSLNETLGVVDSKSEAIAFANKYMKEGF